MAEVTGEGPHDAGLWRAAEEVGDRWALVILGELRDGPRRFGDLQRALPGIAPNVLTQRLRRLVDGGLASAEPYSHRPPRMVYELTSAGRDLDPVLRGLSAWGAERAGVEGPRHAACGTTLETRLWCPLCGTVVDPGDAGDDLHHL